MSSTNGSSPTIPTITVDLSMQSGLATVGILMNFLLVVTTIRTKNLHSTCNWLIALDAFCQLLYLSCKTIPVLLLLFGIYPIPMSICIPIHTLPMFGVLMDFQLIAQIGVERLLNILFPVWSRKSTTVRLQIGLLLFSSSFCIFLIFLLYNTQTAAGSMDRMVLCKFTDAVYAPNPYATVSSTYNFVIHILAMLIYVLLWIAVSKLDGQNTQNIVKDVHRSLMVIIAVEAFGWFPIILSSAYTTMAQAQLNPTLNSMLIFFATYMSILTSSCLMPTLYIFSKTYRAAINQLLRVVLPWKCQQTSVISSMQQRSVPSAGWTNNLQPSSGIRNVIVIPHH